MSDWRATGIAEADLRPGTMQAASVAGVDIALARTEDGRLAAFDQWCSHEECPLADGDLEGDKVLCYCHSSEFDIWTGAVLHPPATEPLQVYDVQAQGGELRVRMPDAG